MPNYSYDGVDLMATSVYSVRNRPQLAAPRKRLVAQDLGVRAGQRIASAVDGARTIVLEGCVEGTSASDLEAQVDTLKRVLDRPRKRLIASFQDGRFYIPAAVEFEETGGAGFYMEYRATFHLEHPYQFAPTPSGDVRSPTLALLPDQTTQYGLRYSLTPGGTRPAPLRALISNPVGGNTPTLVQLVNYYDGTVRPRGLTVTTSLAATELIAIDPDVEQIVKATMTNVVGWFPLEDASGNALDVSGDARNLTANGSISYRQDGVLGACCAFTTTSTFFDRADATFGFTGNFSAGAWVNHDALGAAAGIIGKRATSNAGWGISKSAADAFVATVGNGASTRTVTSLTPATAGKWYRVVLTFTQSTGTLRLYVNGRIEAVTAGGAFTPTNAGNNFRVAAVHNTAGTAEAMVGRIDEPFACDKVLSDTEVRDDFDYSLAYALRSAKLDIGGYYPSLDPRVATTNTIRVRADHSSSAPTPLVVLAWRSRYA